MPVWGVLCLLGSKNRTDPTENKNEIDCKQLFCLIYKPCFPVTPSRTPISVIYIFFHNNFVFSILQSMWLKCVCLMMWWPPKPYNYIDLSKLEGFKWHAFCVLIGFKIVKILWNVFENFWFCSSFWFEMYFFSLLMYFSMFVKTCIWCLNDWVMIYINF